jgi:hypothetical protein
MCNAQRAHGRAEDDSVAAMVTAAGALEMAKPTTHRAMAAGPGSNHGRSEGRRLSRRWSRFRRAGVMVASS